MVSCAHRFNSNDARQSRNLAQVSYEKTNSTQSYSQSSLPTQEQVGATAEYHFTMAQAYSVEGNPDRAIEEYKLALIYDQKSALIRTRLAGEYIKKGLLSAAIEVCKEAIENEPSSVDAHFLLASFYTSTLQHSLAIQHYQKVLKLDPKHEEAVAYEAQSHLELGCAQCAVRVLNTFLKKSPDSAMALYYLGRAYHKSGKHSDAEVNYRKAVRAKDGFTQASLALGFLYEEQKKIIKAIEVYESLYDQYQNLSAANRLSTIYLKAEQYKKAIPYLEAIQSLDSDDMNAKVKLGLVYMETKQWDKAVTVFKGLLKGSPDSDRIRFYLANLYEEIGLYDDAVAEFKNINSSSKLYVDATLHVANIYKNTGKLPLSKEHLKNALVASPQTMQFYIYLASLEEESEQNEEAIKVLEIAYKYFPDDEKVLYYLGSLYDRVGLTEKSIAKMEQIIFLNPKHADALNYLGYTWSIQGKNLEQAEKYLQIAMSVKPNNPFILDSWGWHLYLNGKVKESIKVLERAVSLKSDEFTIVSHLADAYMKANLQEKAMATYQKAVNLTEDSKEKAQVLAKIEGLRSILVQNGRIKSKTRSPASSGP